MLSGLALILGLAGAQTPSLAPSLSVDLDGDGTIETVVTSPSRNAVHVEIRDAEGRKRAEAAAPAPAADLVHVALTSASIGSAGSLFEVVASTDAMECRTIWRYRGDTLTRLPIRDANGKALADCGQPGEWTSRWERETEGRPSAWVRERTTRAGEGAFRRKDVFAFAGFSLDYDAKRSSGQINGVPIPSWYGAILYTRKALERLYDRFQLASIKSEPTLRLETDRQGGVFALRFSGPQGETVAPVEAYSSTAVSPNATLVARVGDKAAHVSIRLGGDGSVPIEARVDGLGAPFDGIYAPAGSWRGGARQVFPTAADEVGAEHLVGTWGNAQGKNTSIAVEGAPPYRVRLGPDTFTVDMEHAPPPTDLLLLPVGRSGRPFAILLRGPNAIERIPLACAGEGPALSCRVDGESETLRRIGARVNVQ